VFGFNVREGTKLAGAVGAEDALRAYVRQKSIGCNGKKMFCGGKQHTGTHIKLDCLPENLRLKLSKGA
jgi:hypothetical protein